MNPKENASFEIRGHIAYWFSVKLIANLGARAGRCSGGLNGLAFPAFVAFKSLGVRAVS